MELELLPRLSRTEITPEYLDTIDSNNLSVVGTFPVFLVVLVLEFMVFGVTAISFNFNNWCQSKRLLDRYYDEKINQGVDSYVLAERMTHIRYFNTNKLKKCWVLSLVCIILAIILQAMLIALSTYSLEGRGLKKELESTEFYADLDKEIDSLKIDEATNVSSIALLANAEYEELFKDYALEVENAFDVNLPSTSIELIKPFINEFADMLRHINYLEEEDGFSYFGEHIDFANNQRIELMKCVSEAFEHTEVFGFYGELKQCDVNIQLPDEFLRYFDETSSTGAIISLLGLEQNYNAFVESEFFKETNKLLCSSVSNLRKSAINTSKSLNEYESMVEKYYGLTNREYDCSTSKIENNYALVIEIFVCTAAGITILLLLLLVIIEEFYMEKHPLKVAQPIILSSPVQLLLVCVATVAFVFSYYLSVKENTRANLQNYDYESNFSVLQKVYGNRFSSPPLNAEFFNIVSNSYVDLLSYEELNGNTIYKVKSSRAFSLCGHEIDLAAIPEVKISIGNARSLNTIDGYLFNNQPHAAFISALDKELAEEFRNLGIFGAEPSIDHFATYFEYNIQLRDGRAMNMHVVQRITEKIDSDSVQASTGIFSGVSDFRLRADENFNIYLQLARGIAIPIAFSAPVELFEYYEAFYGFVAFVGCMEAASVDCREIDQEIANRANTDGVEFLNETLNEKLLLFNVSKTAVDLMAEQFKMQFSELPGRFRSEFESKFHTDLDQQMYGRIRQIAELLPGHLDCAPNSGFYSRFSKSAWYLMVSLMIQQVDAACDAFGDTASDFTHIDNFLDTVGAYASAGVESIRDNLIGQNYWKRLYERYSEILLFELDSMRHLDAAFFQLAAAEPLRYEVGALSWCFCACYASYLLLWIAELGANLQRSALTLEYARNEGTSTAQEIAQSDDADVIQPSTGEFVEKNQYMILQKIEK